MPPGDAVSSKGSETEREGDKRSLVLISCRLISAGYGPKTRCTEEMAGKGGIDAGLPTALKGQGCMGLGNYFSIWSSLARTQATSFSRSSRFSSARKAIEASVSKSSWIIFTKRSDVIFSPMRSVIDNRKRGLLSSRLAQRQQFPVNGVLSDASCKTVLVLR